MEELIHIMHNGNNYDNIIVPKLIAFFEPSTPVPPTLDKTLIQTPVKSIFQESFSWSVSDFEIDNSDKTLNCPWNNVKSIRNNSVKNLCTPTSDRTPVKSTFQESLSWSGSDFESDNSDKTKKINLDDVEPINNRPNTGSKVENLCISGRFRDSEFTSSIIDRQFNRKHKNCVLQKIDLPRKILVIGQSGTGKTAYIKRYISKSYDSQTQWTAGVDFALKLVKWSEDISIKLQLWDIAGQERFASMTRVYYKDAHACIVMFDLSNRQSFLNAHKWKQDLDSKCSLPDGSPIPCILLGNKCDLEHREVQHSEIEKFCKDHEFIGWTEISVKDDLMVEDSMRFLLDDMMSRYGHLEDSTNELVSNSKVIRLNKPRDDDNIKDKKNCLCS